MRLSQRVGILFILIIYATGLFATVDLFRKFNIKNQVIGFFYTEPEVVKISDFEYDINSLLFKNSGVENQYYAEVNAKPVSNFDNTKKYSVTVNGILANRVRGNYAYVNSEFTNIFSSALGNELLTDTLNIKVNFYTDSTKIVFITNNGENAVQLWTSYIAKNGMKIKIVETNYDSQIQADNLTTYTATLMCEDEVYDTIEFNALSTERIPYSINNQICAWKDVNNISYNSLNELPLQNITLFADFRKVTININITRLESDNDDGFFDYMSRKGIDDEDEFVLGYCLISNDCYYYQISLFSYINDTWSISFDILPGEYEIYLRGSLMSSFPVNVNNVSFDSNPRFNVDLTDIDSYEINYEYIGKDLSTYG